MKKSERVWVLLYNDNDCDYGGCWKLWSYTYYRTRELARKQLRKITSGLRWHRNRTDYHFDIIALNKVFDVEV